MLDVKHVNINKEPIPHLIINHPIPINDYDRLYELWNKPDHERWKTLMLTIYAPSNKPESKCWEVFNGIKKTWTTEIKTLDNTATESTSGTCQAFAMTFVVYVSMPSLGLGPKKLHPFENIFMFALILQINYR